ncbi:MAG: acyl carrier protein [Planctomycetes bacterium]|nr:acyl carrier protein [Planctomycetota bacterium]
MGPKGRVSPVDALVDQIKTLIIDHLNLEDVDPAGVDPQAPLFGEGLGLDSVDALELVMLMETTFGAKIGSSEVGRQAFATLNSLANFVHEHRTK